MVLHKRDISKKTSLVLGGAFTLIRICLAALTPVLLFMTQDSEADDVLFVTLAHNILQGDWLGTYGKYTLAKNPGYSLFVAFCGATHIPYQLAFITLVILGSIAFVRAVRPALKSNVAALVLYVLLLFTPTLFTTAFFARVYRDGLTIPFALMAFAGLIGIYLRRKSASGMRTFIPWAIIESIGIAGLQIIKENGTWIAPFALVCSLVIVTSWIIQTKRHILSFGTLLGRCALLVLPVLASLALTTTLASINASKYGVATLNERFNGSFVAVCEDLVDLDTNDTQKGIWVSRTSVTNALSASKTLRSIEPELWQEWSSWASIFDGNEVYCDMAYWALRAALDNAGGFTSATDTESFWGAVHTELTEALEAGTLRRTSGLKISAVAPPIANTSDMLSLISNTLWTSFKLATYQIMDTHLIANRDALESLDATIDTAENREILSMLGSNAYLTVGSYETTSYPATVRIANTLDRYLGHIGVAICRVLLVMLLGAIIYIAVCKREHTARNGELMLIIAGLLLSALAFEAAISWYVSYKIYIFSVESYLLEAYKYSSEFYTCLGLAIYLGFSAFVVDRFFSKA